MAETTYYQSRHTGEEIDNLFDESIAATKAANEAAENANTAVEDIPAMFAGKADLDPDTGYIPSSQIAPLQGLQTGVNTSNGFFLSEDPALLFEGDRTVAVLFTTGPNTNTVREQIYCDNSNSMQSGTGAWLNNQYLYVSYKGSTQVGIAKVDVNTTYLLIITNEKAYLNGIKYKLNTTGTQNTEFIVIGASKSGANAFKGVVHNSRIFNYIFSDSDADKLWNNADPMAYMLPNEGTLKDSCVAEYLPCGLLADKWRDTAGNSLDLTANNTPELSYQSIPDQRDIVIDSGIFFTDISEGTTNKRIDVPAGYVALVVAVYNYNESALTNVIVQNWTDERAFIYGATVNNARAVYSVSAAGNKSTYSGVGITIDPTVQYLKVMATGNTTSGGMRVRVICKYLGI